MKNYKVLILGARGSGKTVFLSSMYYHLSMATSTNFYIETKSSYEGKLLKNSYIGLLTDWPEPNIFAEMKDWTFRCFVKAPSQNFETFTVTYYDYSGGRLTDAIEDEEEFQSILNESDIILGFLDGDKIVNSASYTSSSWMLDLDAIITELDKKHQQGKPIHLIISKWDLLHNKNINILDVREKLFGYPRFKQFASNIAEKRDFIRLIPVSSVGFNFAEKIDSEMKIREGATLEPYNVDVPLALALLDPMQSKLSELMKEFDKLPETVEVEVSANLKWWEKLSRWAGSKLEKIVTQNQIDITELNNLAEYWKKTGEEKVKAAKEKEESIRESLRTKIHKVNDQKSAIDYIITSFHSIETKIDAEHPNSIIQ